MGCGASVKEVKHDPNSKNKEIDDAIQHEKSINAFKILCLGGGETGKSTFLKQLNVIYHKQTKASERAMYRQVLQMNTMQTIGILLRECERFNYKLNEDEQKLIKIVSAHDISDPMTPDVAIAIQELWKSEAMQQTYARRTEYWILDACGYYMSNCHRFVQTTFVPTDYDIIMARRRTTGIVEAQFMDEGAKWNVVDVGGQRSERRKWMLCFDGVDAVIFFVNAAGFNRPLFEDNMVTEHQEALSLLEQTFSNKVFNNTPVFLFFNKLDLFRDALDRGRPLGKYFPEYKGPMEEIPMLDHLQKLFQAKMPNAKPVCQVHFMSACNRNDVTKAFKRVREYLASTRHSNTIRQKEEGQKGDKSLGAEVFTPPREPADMTTPQPMLSVNFSSKGSFLSTTVKTDLPGTPTNVSAVDEIQPYKSNAGVSAISGLDSDRDRRPGSKTEGQKIPTLNLPRDIEA